MLFRNFTPFPPLQFESRDEKRRDFGVVVLRGTFSMEPGRELRLVQEQAPLVMADQYFGEPGKSSLHFENNIAPYKPRTDIHVIADAVAPGGRPARQWTAGIEIGSLRKEISVTGPRAWQRGMARGMARGWQLSEPSPVAEVPLRYELAYGGTKDNGAGPLACETNPIGVGFVDVAKLDPSKPVPAPQILPVGSPAIELGKTIPTEGLAPVPPSWLPRRAKAGTFNAVWEKTRWPDLPADFSFDFYNSAAPGLVYPGFVKGDETVRLTHLHPLSPFEFKLPSFELALLLRFLDGQIVPAPVVLDTIHIELSEERVYLVWRGIFPLDRPLRVLEVRMRAPDYVIERPAQTSKTYN